MKGEIKEINIPENVLIALGDLTNGALNYYKANETVKVKHNTILDYITNSEEKYDCMYDKLTSESTEWESKYYKLQEENNIYKLRHEKAIKKLSSAIKHYKLEDKNNAIRFTKEILEGKDITEKTYKILNGEDKE